MKIIEYQGGNLMNVEVKNVVEERIKHRTKSLRTEYADRNWMDHKVLHYVQLSTLPPSSTLVSLREMGISSIEILQMINFQPTQPVDIHVIIEKCEERYNEEQVEDILSILATGLGLVQDDENDERTTE